MSFRVRKLVAGWALGPGQFLGLAVHSLVVRLWSAKRPTWPAEARNFVVRVVTGGGRITRARDSPGTVRVDQQLDDIPAHLTSFVRPGTSDLVVWSQVVFGRQYGPVVDVIGAAVAGEVETILDLGANIGLTTAYFGAVYPKARILAVEPEPESFQLLKRNTETLGDRVRAQQAAFWTRHEPLIWTSRQFRDGREWARAVQGTMNPADSIEVITPAEALAQLEVDRADLAKIDIEGAEAAFFATEDGTDALLGLADVFAIELHLELVDPFQAAEAFDRRGFLTIPVGDFVIAIRRDRIR